MDGLTLVFGLGEALSGNELTFLLTLALLAIFMLAVPFHLLRASERSIAFARSAPATLVSVGVLGTLVSLFATLQAFDTSARDASLPSLVEGLRAASATGLLGVLLALTYRTYERLVPSRKDSPGADEGSPEPAGLALETATDLTSLNATLVGEFQKLHTVLETQLEESRSESQQSFEDLGVGVQTLSEQGEETLKQVEETPLVSADEECEAEPNAPARRFLFRIPVDYEAGGQCGKGTLIDISSSGALIEDVDLPLSLGAFVEICYKLEGEEKPTLLYGKVTRESESGFAVEFVERRTG